MLGAASTATALLPMPEPFALAGRIDMPDRIDCTPELLTYLDALVAEGNRLLEDDAAIDYASMPVDESDREASMREHRPVRRQTLSDYPSSILVKSADFGAWYAASHALLESVCGKEHSWPTEFAKFVYAGCRGCVAHGVGVLRAFRLAWSCGALWR